MESQRARIARMHDEYETLCVFIPVTKCQLNFHTPFQLLIATMLSAQTTDKRVNEISPELFDWYPDAHALANARLEDVEQIIRPLGFYHTKSEHIITAAMQLVAQFHGEVPHTMEDLTSLPGVGRKTANVVLGNAFGIPGFPVDTHVMRVTARLHWFAKWNSKLTADQIHDLITPYFPPEEWTDLSHRIIIFGRNICVARNPQCDKCPLRDSCPSASYYLEQYAQRAAMQARKKKTRRKSSL